MDKIKSDLMKAANNNDDLLSYLSEMELSDKDTRAKLYKWLQELHNNGSLDIVSAFNELKNDKSHEFFLV